MSATYVCNGESAGPSSYSYIPLMLKLTTSGYAAIVCVVYIDGQTERILLVSTRYKLEFLTRFMHT